MFVHGVISSAVPAAGRVGSVHPEITPPRNFHHLRDTTFVFAEVQKIATWSAPRCGFSHFRDKERNEVDIVVENRRGETVGIEVKASATVSSGDFSGMRKLAEACGDRFVQGLVLYDHDQVVPFGDRMFAAPLSCLWSAT